MNVLLALAVATSLGQSDDPTGPDSMAARARNGSIAVLNETVRNHPDDIRPAFRILLRAAAHAAGDSLESFSAAEYLAAAYASAWRDSFLVREVVRFRSWSPADRRVKVTADSLRAAGNGALGSQGATAAVQLWRRSVRLAATIGDTADMAAALGNIGRAFYDETESDSAAAYWTRSADLAQRIGDWRTAGNAVGNLASVHKDRGELRQAESLYARAGTIRARTGDSRGLAADENNRGLIAQTLGDFAAAELAFRAALESNRRANRSDPAAINLINLGNLAALTGQHDSAEARYDEALALCRRENNRVRAADVWHDIGLLRIARGDYPAAITALVSALRVYDVMGPLTDAASTRRDLAIARAAGGDLQQAMRELQRAESAAGREPGNWGLLARIAMARADVAAQLNLPDADRAYERAQGLYQRAKDEAGAAEAIQGRGYLLLRREEYARARDVLRAALPRQASARGRAWTQLLLGFALRSSGDTVGARTVLMTAFDTLRVIGDVAGEGAALGALGDLAALEGIGFTAESLYRRGLERLSTAGIGPVPSVSWTLHAGLGAVLQDRGALSQAAAELRAAAADVENVARFLPLEQRRASYLADKWDVYAQLALVERARGRIDAAFETSEELRARQMLDLLARGRIAWRSAIHDSLFIREQDLRLRISDLTSRLESPGPDQLREKSGAATAALREALNRAQQAYADLLARVQEARPEYAHLVSGQVVALRDVQRELAPDEAFLEYMVADSATLAFVVRRDTAAMVDLAIGRDALAALIDFSRAALTAPAARGMRPPPSWRAPLDRLGTILIDPLETSGLLDGARVLLIAPHGDLHYLPFAALHRSGAAPSFLVERYAIVMVPSASVWLRLRKRTPDVQPSGVLALAPRVDALPGSQAEVVAIGRFFGARSRLLIGARATRHELEDAAPSQSIIHFATYGVLNKHNPLFSFIELAAEPGADGRLEVHDVFGLELRARLVVLSACQTALGAGALADVPAGDDWVGLVEAFLYAGAGHVLATLWPVADRTTAAFMTHFYREVAAGDGEAEALAVAQRATLRNSTTSDPFYWAGFTLSGGR